MATQSTRSLRPAILTSSTWQQTGGFQSKQQHRGQGEASALLLSAAASQRSLFSSRIGGSVPSLLVTQRLRPPPGSTHRFLSGDAADRKATTVSSVPAPPLVTADAVYNLPNTVSAARLLSGPVIGYWLLNGHYEAATVALAISGASDWLDGFLARRLGASSVFGSYLDPLADKVLIGCVAAALLANGAMPTWLAAVVVGRDVLLVSGAFVFRLRGFGWRWPGREAFFRTADTASQAPAASWEGGGDHGREVGVAFMRPLLISKFNTVLQLVLLGGYLTRGIHGWPEADSMLVLELLTATTTTMSLAAYGTMAVQGKLFK